MEKEVLLPETIYAHMGFSFYNLSRNCDYQQERIMYLAKAIEFLEKSYEISSQNYLVCFVLAKSYLSQYQLDLALQYCIRACTLNKYNLNSFTLLSLIYSAKGELTKSQLLIDQLMDDNPKQPILYIMKAYIETELWLWNLEKNQNLTVAEKFGEGVRAHLISVRHFLAAFSPPAFRTRHSRPMPPNL